MPSHEPGEPAKIGYEPEPDELEPGSLTCLLRGFSLSHVGRRGDRREGNLGAEGGKGHSVNLDSRDGRRGGKRKPSYSS